MGVTRFGLAEVLLTRKAAAVVLLLAGFACLGLRVMERLLGGFVGELSLAGAHVVVPRLPLTALGVAAIGSGCVLLWRRPSR